MARLLFVLAAITAGTSPAFAEAISVQLKSFANPIQVEVIDDRDTSRKTYVLARDVVLENDQVYLELAAGSVLKTLGMSFETAESIDKLTLKQNGRKSYLKNSPSTDGRRLYFKDGPAFVAEFDHDDQLLRGYFDFGPNDKSTFGNFSLGASTVVVPCGTKHAFTFFAFDSWIGNDTGDRRHSLKLSGCGLTEKVALPLNIDQPEGDSVFAGIKTADHDYGIFEYHTRGPIKTVTVETPRYYKNLGKEKISVNGKLEFDIDGTLLVVDFIPIR